MKACKFLGVSLILATVLGMGGIITGCEDAGPAEEAGEEVDDAVDDAGDAIDEARDETEEAADDLSDTP